jgi:hypothetical protein
MISTDMVQVFKSEYPIRFNDHEEASYINRIVFSV